jgi:hypothetical protein
MRSVPNREKLPYMPGAEENHDGTQNKQTLAKISTEKLPNTKAGRSTCKQGASDARNEHV